MEKSEPALAPQWYKVTNGSATGNSTLNHKTGSSSHSDERGIGLSSRNRLSASDCDRNFSSYRRSSSSNGPVSHEKDSSAKSQAYGSFARNYHERDQEKNPDLRDRENSLFLVDNEFHDHFDSLISSRTEKDTLRRSHCMVSGRRVDVWPKRPGGNSISDALARGSIIGGMRKTFFERDFPSLGAEDRQGPPGAGKVSSVNAVQRLPLGAAAIIGGNGWTSALAEVPIVPGAIGQGLSSAPRTTPVNQVTAAPSTTTSLNMVEALAQAPSRLHTASQLSLDTQRMEGLTLRQHKKLIPVTPSMPKSLVFNSSEKSKSKAARGGDCSALPKLVNHAVHAPARSDITKTSPSGNLQVLNRERNDISPPNKEGPSISKASRPVGLVPLVVAIPQKTPINSKVDTKVTALPQTRSSFGEKRPFSQAQNRSEFFNSIRKKASNCSSAPPEPSCVASSSSFEKLVERAMEAANHFPSNSGLNCSLENGDCEDFSIHQESMRLADSEESNPCFETAVDPEEEAFLESLGWDKNGGEEALTEEEIDAFAKEYERRIQFCDEVVIPLKVTDWVKGEK